MDKQILSRYLEKKSIPVVMRKKKSYLTYEGIPDRYVYILKKGIIKTSVVTHEGREFNLRYLNDFEIVSLFKDEYSQEVEAPFNVRVESEEAALYKIVRDQFWTDVNHDRQLQDYVKEYYRKNLMDTMKKMQQMLMNGKYGAVCTQINELYETFGVKTADGVLIDFEVTNEEIARFCGITSASSVNRMMQRLREAGALQSVDRKLLVKNIEMIRENIIY
ncbi:MULTISPECIES: Crp/Fnr family transcriptional regulator [unclassified Enterococcus]|uniref:Crp/Fnr family transcriptional regulator n=1 Tax=unclassified Enterococcus TaxID=2608891 RepID=UPI0006B992B6|nr:MULTISPECIES: Crp/Fnr family transcriptional regulator [unclassified Enterococcus]KPG70160.1 Crp/Fnr family transcriptional regulator [Enterococcus sp. RIT-PI-f]